MTAIFELPKKQAVDEALRKSDLGKMRLLVQAYLFHRDNLDQASMVYAGHDDFCRALGDSKSYDMDKLLASKGFMNHMFYWEANPLVIAIGEYDFRKARWLLMHGALVDGRHLKLLLEKTSAFMLRFQEETEDVAIMMIDRIADLNGPIGPAKGPSDGPTPLDLLVGGWSMTKALRHLVEKGVRLNTPGIGCPALSSCNPETVCILLEGGADANTRLPKIGRTFRWFTENAVHYMSGREKSWRKAFMLYLRKGVGLTVEDFPKAGQTVGLLAYLDNPEYIQMVIDEITRRYDEQRGIDLASFLKMADSRGLTPLNHALLERNAPKIDILLTNMGRMIAGR